MRQRLTIALAALAVTAALTGLVVGPAAAQPVRMTVSLGGGGTGQDPDGSGSATLTLDPEAGTVCFELSWTKIRGPFAAHVHVGAAGAAGDIVIHLFDMKGGTPLAGSIKGVSGCAKNPDGAAIDAVLANPSGYYVNVHNVKFPGGAIRGQLGAGSSPSPTSGSGSGGTPSPYPRSA